MSFIVLNKKLFALIKKKWKPLAILPLYLQTKKNLVVVDNSNLVSRNEQILSDNDTYKLFPKSRQKSIGNQANKIIRTICKTLPRSDFLKLLTCGSRPAHFYSLIKDHKILNDNDCPLRPIALVNDTATEKVDWFLSTCSNS